MNCSKCGQPLKPGAEFCGNCGTPVTNNPAAPTVAPSTPAAPVVQPAQPAAALPQSGMPVPPPVVSSATTPSSTNKDDKKAIAAFVLGALGCVGWLIPLVGVILGLAAMILGTLSLKSAKRKFAIVAIVLSVLVLGASIFNWIKAIQDLKSGKTHTSSSSSKSNTSESTGQSIDTDCYSAKVPVEMKITQTAGSCTFQASNSATSEEYDVKVIKAPSLNASNLDQGAQADAKNVLNSVPGGTIKRQGESTFSGTAAYKVVIGASDDSEMTIDYMYKPTSQGELVIVLRVQPAGKDSNLDTIENSWSWK